MIKKSQIPIFIINLIILTIFTILFANRRNYEFIMYIGVILFFLFLIIATNKKVNYPNYTLWGLTLWSLMHMSGGGLNVKGGRLYELILIQMSETYKVFRYDQLVHIIGFGVSTLIMFHLIKPLINKTNKKWAALSIVIVMAGLGVGALNEIVEFTATLIVAQTGVGGYENTSLDLVADFIGALIALAIIRFKEKRLKEKSI